jgi:sugar phosphate permease
MRWGVLALMTAAHALGSLSVLAVAPLSTFLLDGLGLSRVTVGLFLPAVYLGGVVMSLPAGWLTERFGVRWVLAIGLAVSGSSVALGALAPGLVGLLALLVLGGFGFSILNPTTGRAVFDWFPAAERGLAMGIKQAGLTAGGIASALALPPLAVALGWRAALASAGAVSLACAVVVAAIYRDAGDHTAVRPGARPRLVDLAPVVRRPGVAVVLGCGLALGVTQSGALGYLVLFAREALGMSNVEAGRLLALAHLGGVAGRLGWGAVSDRVFGGRRRPGLALNALIGAAGFAVFALGSAVASPVSIAVAFVVGMGAFGWVGLYFALMAEVGGARFAGLMTGLGVIFAWGGVLLGPPLFGALVEVTGSYSAGWLTLAALAAAVAAVLPRLQPLVARGPARE